MDQADLAAQEAALARLDARAFEEHLVRESLRERAEEACLEADVAARESERVVGVVRREAAERAWSRGRREEDRQTG